MVGAETGGPTTAGNILISEPVDGLNKRRVGNVIKMSIWCGFVCFGLRFGLGLRFGFWFGRGFRFKLRFIALGICVAVGCFISLCVFFRMA